MSWSSFSDFSDSIKRLKAADPNALVVTPVASDGTPKKWDLAFQPGDSIALVRCDTCSGYVPGELYLKDLFESDVFHDSVFVISNYELDGNFNPIPLRGTPTISYTYAGIQSVYPAREATYLESRLAGAAFLSQASDLMASALPEHARQWNKPDGYSVMFAADGYDLTLRTGSSVGFKGMSFLLGPAWHRRTPWGSLTVGGAVEGGRGSYSTHNRYPDRAEVVGDGKVDYLGLAAFASHEFDAGYHAEISLRLGQLRNSFDASGQAAGYRDQLRDAKFNTASTYLGGHLGVGYAFRYRPDILMDVYGQAFWTRLGAAHAAGAVSGRPIRFDADNSVNLRAGVRYTYTGFDRLKLYAGAAYDRGLWLNAVDGQAFGRRLGRLGQPSSEGGTGIFEGGVSFKPSPDSAFTLDLSGRAYSGQTDGGAGSLSLKWEFDADGNLVGTPPAEAAGLRQSPRGGRFYPPSAGQAGGSGAYASGGEGAGGPGTGRGASGNRPGADPLNPVTVETERPDWEKTLSPGAVSVVVPDEYTGEQKTLADLLEKVPGLFIGRTNGAGNYTTVSIRGSTGAQVAVYIDGVPQKKGGDAAVDLSTIPLLNVARIEVYRGYIPVRFDGAPIGGVINVVTKRPEDARTRILLGMRSLGGYNGELTFSSPLGPGSLLVGAAHDRSDGDFKYRFPGSGAYGTIQNNAPRYRRRLSNGFRKTDLMAKWQDENWFAKVAWKDHVVQLARYLEAMGPDSTDLPPDLIHHYFPASSESPLKVQRTVQRDFTLGRRQTWGDLDWGLRVDYTTQNKRYSYVNVPSNYPDTYGSRWSLYDTRRWAATLDASYKLGTRNLIELHADYSKETLHVDVNGRDTPTGYSSETVLDSYSQKIWHLQLQDTFNITESGDFQLTAVIRYDKMDGDTAKGKNLDGNMGWVKTWGVALKKDFGSFLTLRASYGTFNRFPNFYEMFGDGAYIYPSVLAGSPEDHVGREHGKQFDAGADLRGTLFGVKGRATVNYFNRLVHDGIMLIARRDMAKYVNNQSMRHEGLEFETHLTYGPLGLDIAATRQRFKSVGKNKNRQYPYMVQLPERIVNTRLTLKLFGGRVEAFGEYNHTGKLDHLSDVNDKDPAYVDEINIVNAGIKLHVTDSLKVTLGGSDLTNQGPKQHFLPNMNRQEYKYALVPYPREGRILYTSVEFNF
ncbi:MAG: TonB-dependent receptor plug domain-containing protein [Deltaproteobacteria bacterium]|nr:TonB-dependent receptor plug domain-containing protein [Deltaproteobacteria bacterium]